MKIPLFRVWVIVIALAIIVLAWLIRKKERKKEEDRRFGRLATCRCGTPAMVSSNVNDLVADENTRE